MSYVILNPPVNYTRAKLLVVAFGVSIALYRYGRAPRSPWTSGAVATGILRASLWNFI